MEQKRYFRIINTRGLSRVKKDDIAELILDDGSSIQPLLLANEEWDGHDVIVTDVVPSEYRTHCFWFDRSDVEEIKQEEAQEELDPATLINKKVIDIYNNYTGIVTAYSVWNTGYKQVLVESIDSTGRPISDWLDIRRIKEEK